MWPGDAAETGERGAAAHGAGAAAADVAAKGKAVKGDMLGW